MYAPDDNNMIGLKFTEYFTCKLVESFVNFRLHHMDKKQLKLDLVSIQKKVCFCRMLDTWAEKFLLSLMPEMSSNYNRS